MCGMRNRREEGEPSLLYLIQILLDPKDAIYWLIIEELRRMETSSDTGRSRYRKTIRKIKTSAQRELHRYMLYSTLIIL